VPTVTFDTCIFITFKPLDVPKGFRLTAVVLQELTAGADDHAEVKAWNHVRLLAEKDKTLLVPTAEDWWTAGKILNFLQRRMKSPKSGKIPPLPKEQVHRIIRDVLIAVLAKRANAILVTDNLADFALIHRFCTVRLVSGDDFFGVPS
jgi:predicted nucleic acid-binding protein